ncbi:MAG TPA: hypothetical protein ENN22_08885 [bacterium]|nr:hypothetical protein [bacterium]
MNLKKFSNTRLQPDQHLSSFVSRALVLIVLLSIISWWSFCSLFDSDADQVSVDAFVPSGEVALSTNISVTFSKDVVEDSLLNQWLPSLLLKFEPPLPGKSQWIDRDQLRFFPDVQLSPSTEYTAELIPADLKTFGFSIKGDRRFQFHTQRFRINSAWLSFEFKPDTEATAKLLASIEFNYDVSPEAAIKYITLNYKNGSTIPFKLVTTAPGRTIALEAENVKRDAPDQQIELKIAAGLKPIQGKLGLHQDYLKTIAAPHKRDLKIERVMPVREGPKQLWVRVQFNLPVDAKQAKQFIKIEPSLSTKIQATHHYLDFKGNFELEKPYRIFIKKGLRAVDGSLFSKDFETTVSFRKENIPPQIDFVGKGFYLTRSGHLNIGIATINVDQVSVEIDKIFSNNLTYLLNENDPANRYQYFWYNIRSLGKNVKQFDLTIQKVENDEVITPINIQDYLKEERNGIYNITVMDSRQRWVRASKWVMATDFGIIAKRAGDDLWVWVNSLTSLQPVANAEVRLLSQNNQLLKSGKTNTEGLVIFRNLTVFDDQLPPFLVTAELGDDLCFLELKRRKISTSDFNVEGDPYLQHGYQAFLYNQRGVYRPGETTYIAGVIRGENNIVPQPFPVILQIKDPENKILDEQRAMLNEQGGVEFKISIPQYAKTGNYRASLLIGEHEEIGTTSFNVEEFIPDRMKVRLTTDADEYGAGETLKINVDAVTLFGPPASGRQVQADIEIEAYPFSPEKWKSFTFQDQQKLFSQQRYELGEQTLDENGKHSYSFDIPENLEAPSALRGVISATVLEPGGRGVSAYRSVIIHPYNSYIGLRQATPGYATPNQDTEIQFVLTTTSGELITDRKLEVNFYRVYWHSILKRVTSYGQYRYVSEMVEELAQQFNINSQNQIASFKLKPEDYGKYLVVVRDPLTGASASLSFYASGWGYSPWAMDNPDRVELDLDQQEYVPGQTAKIQIRAPFPGKLLLTVERETIFTQKVVHLPENTATLELEIREQYKPNVFVSAHLIRSTESLERDTPVRAFGVVPLKLNTEGNKLIIDVDVPDQIRPNNQLTVKYRLKNFKGGAPRLTIAAVDEGICQLTDFQTPDPHGFFFGKKRLTVETADIYSLILPEIESTASSPSGGVVEARRKKHISPVSVTRVKPVAFWSGLLKTDGSGSVKFDIPQFNGTLRIMAVAFAGDRFGNQEKQLFVRDPIVMTPTLPRFIASGDEFTAPVAVYNGTAARSEFEVKLEVDGPVKILDGNRQQVQVPKGKEGLVQFRLKAEETVGKITFKLIASGNGEKSEMSETVPLRPPVPFTTLSGSGSITEDTPAAFTFPKDWLEGTAEFSLAISAFPAVEFSQSLQFLLSYPHGCIEQTTSKLFPLLYFKELAKIAEPELFQNTSVDYFIEQGITKLENLQLESGAFAYWPQGDYINNWSSIYTSHFLVEARKAGYQISKRVYRKMLDALRQYSRDYRNDEEFSLQTAVYACYVLALAGKPERSTNLYFKNSLLDKLTEFSRYQLAGAFALSGDLQSARLMLPRTVQRVVQDNQRQSGGNFNSAVRAYAIMLDVLAEVDPTNSNIPVLVEMLTQAASERGRWYTTQENAFAFLALGKILKSQSRGNYTGTLTIGQDVLEKFAVDNYHYADKNWAGKKVSVTIEGEGVCYYSWRAQGIPSKMRTEEFDHDLMVRRHYLNEQAIPMNYADFRQGDLIIAKITVKPLHESLDNVAVIDMLPAGFEIENPRLQSRKGVGWIKDDNYQPAYLDIRDDRLILFGNFPHAKESTFYYGLRAVTQGKFILPPILAEAMYAPEKASVASSGEIVVLSR